MSKFIVKVEHIPNFQDYPITRKGLNSSLQPLGCQLLLWDYNFFFVCHVDWGKIFEDVLLNQPDYTKDRFDCEDFALLTVARILEKYKLNTCGIAIGDSPHGYHGFNIFLSEQGLFYLEPQDGMVYPVTEDSGYKAELVIFG